MKKVLVDGFSLTENNPAGVSSYTYHLISQIAKSNPKFRLDIAFPPPLNKNFDQQLAKLQNDKKVNLSPINLSYLWTQIGLSSKTFLKFPSILFSTRHTLPLISNPFTKKVLTVHDVGFEKYHTEKDANLNKNSLQRSVKIADKIIAVSNYTKDKLVEELNVKPEKITVIYEGVDFSTFNDAKNDTKTIEQVKAKYNINNYILFVGTIQPRKNLKNQFAAFAKFNLEASQIENVDFVVAGAKGWQYEQVLAKPQALGIKDKIKFIGRVSDKDLPYLISGARLLSFVSLEEGFGLPVLNAFSAGVPVITSNNSALKEIAKDSALVVSPENIDQIADAYRTMYFNNILQSDFIDKGIKKARMFSWEKTAKQTIELFNSLL